MVAKNNFDDRNYLVSSCYIVAMTNIFLQFLLLIVTDGWGDSFLSFCGKNIKINRHWKSGTTTEKILRIYLCMIFVGTSVGTCCLLQLSWNNILAWNWWKCKFPSEQENPTKSKWKKNVNVMNKFVIFFVPSLLPYPLQNPNKKME